MRSSLSPSPRTRRSFGWIPFAAALALVATACGGSGPPAPGLGADPGAGDTLALDSASGDPGARDSGGEDRLPSGDLGDGGAGLDPGSDAPDAEIPPPPESCNGSPVLCLRRFDQVAYATTHNAMSSEEDGFAAPNQLLGVTRQLDRGVRALMLDTHMWAGEAYLCHGICQAGRRPLVDTLRDIKAFLDLHPREVLTIIFEAHISPERTAKAFADAGLLDLLWAQPRGEPWPTLGEMVGAGRRLVVFSDDPSGGALPWHHYVWDYAWETPFAAKTPDDLLCDTNRGSEESHLFILNHFLTAPLASRSLAEQVNFNPFLLDRALLCRGETNHQPNFVTVDFASVGDLQETVDLLNDLGPPRPDLPQGVLQLRVEHDLAPGCADRGGCFARTDAPTSEIRAWLTQIRRHSNLAVLHWDRPLPWDAFAVVLPEGADPVAFYSARLDPELRGWIDAFAEHFEAMPARYLAISPISSGRDRLVARSLPSGEGQEAAEACGPIGPGAVVHFQALAGVPALDVEVGPAFGRFADYLVARLHPDDLALGIEVNLFAKLCPSRWPDYAALYHALVARLRPRLDPAARVFATLHLQTLLGWDLDTCAGGPVLVGCDQPPPADPAFPAQDPDTCFPLARGPLDDLRAGGDLDLLALSFYPDPLGSIPGQDLSALVAWPAEAPEQGSCVLHGWMPPLSDPISALDRLGWTGPVAIAEMGASSAPVRAFLDTKDADFFLVQDHRPAGAAWWMSAILEASRARGFAFLTWDLLRDYDELPLDLVASGGVEPSIWSLFSAFHATALLDREGKPKPGVTAPWDAAVR